MTIEPGAARTAEVIEDQAAMLPAQAGALEDYLLALSQRVDRTWIMTLGGGLTILRREAEQFAASLNVSDLATLTREGSPDAAAVALLLQVHRNARSLSDAAAMLDACRAETIGEDIGRAITAVQAVSESDDPGLRQIEAAHDACMALAASIREGMWYR